MKVKIFFLEKGDSIFIGSDGRDDLLLGVDSDGTRLINEDESQFLKRIEESRGDMGNIVQSLRNFGELTDDLSIIKFSYLKEPIRFQSVGNLNSERFPDDTYLKYLETENWEDAVYYLENLKKKFADEFLPPIFKKELAKVYYKTGKYEEALLLFETLISDFPEDVENMFLASLIYKRFNRYRQAVELGERVMLREPEFLNNVAHLAESYLFIHKRETAIQLLQKVDQLDPNNSHAKKIRIQLDRPVPDHRNG